MAVAFTEVVYFKNDEQQSSTPRLGHSSASSSDNYVMRLQFTTPKTGASFFQFEINNAYWWPLENNITLDMVDHNNKSYFMWALSTSPDKFVNYNYSDESAVLAYDGVVLVKDDNSVDLSNKGYYSLYSEPLSRMLLPNTTYYLWLFPNFQNKYYYWYFSQSPKYNYTVAGSAGVISIREGDKTLTAIPVVKSGSGFITLAATVKVNGELVYCT